MTGPAKGSLPRVVSGPSVTSSDVRLLDSAGLKHSETPSEALLASTSGARIWRLVSRRIRKLHKANGPCYTAQGTSRCFCCFCGKLSAFDVSFSAEILGRRCSCAVPRCFGWKKSKNRKRGITAGDRFIAPSDSL